MQKLLFLLSRLATIFKRTHRERKIEEEQNILDGRRAETHGCRGVGSQKFNNNKNAEHLAK